MKLCQLTVITENQNTIEKAQKLGRLIKNTLNSLEVKNITPYQKFSNSFKLVFVIEIEENKTIQEAVRLTNLISTPWLISVDEFTNEVSLVFNKTELSKFKQQHFNVIRWANFEVVDY